MNYKKTISELKLIENAILDTLQPYLPVDNTKQPETYKNVVNELLNAITNIQNSLELLKTLK